MAHNIEIPVAFEWRPQAANWKFLTAEVTGWALESAQLGPHFVAKTQQDGMNYSLEVPWWAFPLETLRRLQQEKDREFQQTYPLELLSCSAKRLRGKAAEGNSWEMREEFLRLKRDTKALLMFLKHWGTWGRTLPFTRWLPGSENRSRPTAGEQYIQSLLHSQLDPKRAASDVLTIVGSDNPEETALDREVLNYLLPAEVWAFQKQCRDALRKPAGKWLPTQKLLALTPRKQYPYYVLKARNCQSAILNTIVIDLLRKVKFHLCARPDCQAPFAIASRHRRDYCSQYCAHLQSVRRQRSANAKKRALQAKGTTHAKR
jgi:hypothetical protein